MEKKVIISDLTLSAAEGVAETKAKRFWENRMKPYEKVRFLAGHFDRFIEYNPEYVQEGPIQIVVSATKDVGAYQIGPDEYMEDVLVSRTPLRGAKYFVALLGEARNCASSHRRFQRCLYANTFYLHIDGKGIIHLDRLLDNNDWLFATALTALWRLRLSVWAEKCLKRKSRSGAIFPTAKSKISAGSDIMLLKTAGNV